MNDLTFRAPKSVSLLHALGPKDASNEVVNAHDSAATAALDYLERHTAVGRRGTDGIEPIGSSGFVAAAFRHRTSRAGDPLLHTHVLVANLVHCWDDKWSALDGRLLYSHAKTAGYLYQVQLRRELTRRLGVEGTQVRNGTAEIEGIPRAAISEFTRRRAEIEIRMEQRGEHSARAAQVATLDTRRAKDHRVRSEGLLPEWNGQVVPAVNEASRYSTKEMLRLEETLLRAAVERAAESVAVAERSALKATLGRQRSLTPERTEWRQTVLAIEGYREKYGIKDRKVALGGEPRNPEQRHEKEQIERDIQERNDRYTDRSRDEDVGRDRSVELAL